MHIEKMQLRDTETVHRLGKSQAAFKVSGEDAFWTLDQLKCWVRRDEDVLLVAMEEGHVIGFALSTLHRPTGKATWENLYVVPNSRGKGVGIALGNEMVKQLDQRGATYIYFLVRAENVDEVEYFEKRGFEKGFNFVWFGKSV